MTSPRQITLRNPSNELARRLKELSRARGESLNTTILRVLERALGIRERRQLLERYVTWTAQDVEEFERALKSQRTIDDELWR